MSANKQIKDHLVKDPLLKPIIEKVVLPELSISDNVFKELVESIISQQLSTKVASVITDRFHTLHGTKNPNPDLVLEFDHETRRSVGLSNQKAQYIHNIAVFWKENQLENQDWESMSDEEILKLLTQIKGVGNWTVQMILMFALCRTDIFPFDDLGIKQGMMQIYNLNSTGKILISEMHEIAEQWRPYRSVACRYIWRAKDGKIDIE